MPSKRVTRRDAMRLAAAVGAANLWHAPLWLNACTAGAGSAARVVPGSGDPGSGLGAGYPSSVAGAAGDDVTWDADISWWMQNEYAPVTEEREALDLEVIGAIPPELDGVYVRNGPNPKFGDLDHWFLGHGMLHGVRLQAGKALWYRNRYVHTPLIDYPPLDLGISIPNPEAPTCNVSLVQHASRLLALGELGYPFAISPDDLSTQGKHDFGGKLASPFSAHPKVDPVSGELFGFTYMFELPFLRYYRIDRDGVLVQTEDVVLPLRPDGFGSKVAMMHDFQVTATKVVFMNLPIVFNVEAMLSGNKFPFLWDGTNGAHIGIMPREGRSADMVWIEVDPCFIFHGFNAYDDANGNVVLDVARTPPPMWERDNTRFSPSGSLSRFTLDPVARSATLEKLDDRLIGFPQIDRRVTAHRHRYGYAVQYLEMDTKYVERVPAIVKYDLVSGSTATSHEFEASLRPDEAVFVPGEGGAAEDAGYLMSFVYDRTTDRTSLWILDATNLSAPPVAQVRLPFRVPVGFHGLWVPTA